MNLKLILTLACAAMLLPACRKSATSSSLPPPEVTAAPPEVRDIADSIDMTGTTAASQSVDLVARVQGYLDSVNFTDGTYVEAGKLLFVIEPDSYEQQLRIAKAMLAMSQAEYERQLTLLKENATSAANVEKWLSQRDQDAAQVELAKLNLSYTKVTAPFAGRIGRRLVDPGNLVGPVTNSKLATLDQLVPIYVYFNLNERDALRLRAMVRKRGIQPPAGKSIHTPAFVGLQDETGYPHAATLDFIATGLSTSTGTIQMRVTIPNEDRLFVPGLFARIRVPLDKPRPTLVIPAAAIGNDQEGDYVLVVGKDNVVARRSIEKGPTADDGRIAIRSGLTEADRLIVNGMMNAKPGATVMVTAAAAATSAPTTQAH